MGGEASGLAHGGRAAPESRRSRTVPESFSPPSPEIGIAIFAGLTPIP
jgi:hypothetical protein